MYISINILIFIADEFFILVTQLVHHYSLLSILVISAKFPNSERNSVNWMPLITALCGLEDYYGCSRLHVHIHSLKYPFFLSFPSQHVHLVKFFHILLLFILFTLIWISFPVQQTFTVYDIYGYNFLIYDADGYDLLRNPHMLVWA